MADSPRPTGWFLSLCGPLRPDADGDGDGTTATAELTLPPGVLAGADRLLAVEALHQIACRLAARARGARRCVPVHLAELEITDEAVHPEAVLHARLVRSGRLSTVRTSLSVHGLTRFTATVRTQEVT